MVPTNAQVALHLRHLRDATVLLYCTSQGHGTVGRTVCVGNGACAVALEHQGGTVCVVYELQTEPRNINQSLVRHSHKGAETDKRFQAFKTAFSFTRTRFCALSS